MTLSLCIEINAATRCTAPIKGERRCIAIATLTAFFALPSPSIESSYLNVGTDFATNGERHVLERLRKADFRLAVDGGAHLGDWSFQLLERWRHCHIDAFEVAPETVKRLSAKADEHPDRGRLTIHGIGLSDRVGSQAMYFPPDSADLTCDIPRHETLPSIPFVAQTTTLSAICEDHRIRSTS